MKHSLLCGVALTAVLVACGGESCIEILESEEVSNSSDLVVDSSSSREGEGLDGAISSSSKSSSSICRDDAFEEDQEGSSSSKVKSSSSRYCEDASEGCGKISSSAEQSSSSSASSDKDGYSSGIDLGDGWSWDVPKEARLNPQINYGTMVDTRDNKTYKTVKIGGLTWMAENLNYADSVATVSLKGRSWCNENEPKNCEVTGRLYTWAAAIDSATLYKEKLIVCGDGMTCTLPDTVYGICPLGWHLPNNKEWEALLDAVGGASTAGTKLKARSGWSNGGNGTDDYGFSALPPGSMNVFGEFDADGNYADFWSATDGDSGSAYRMCLNDSYEEATIEPYNKVYGFSVRCVKN